MGRERWDVVARVTEGDEHDRYWAQALKFWPAYDTYLERSGRDIKVFVLDRA